MKAHELTPGHTGWHVEAGYAKGLLQCVVPQHGSQLLILVRNKNEGIQGITVDGNDEISVEKTLEEQVKDDLADLKNQTLGWIRRKLK